MWEYVRRVAAERLLVAAHFLADQHRLRVGVANPPPRHDQPSRPGEYPKARTFTGRDAIDVVPDNVAEVLASDPPTVRIGYRPHGYDPAAGGNINYMALLELNRQRLGLRKTLTDLRPQLSALVASATYETA